MKRLLSMAISLAMLLSFLAIPAFASAATADFSITIDKTASDVKVGDFIVATIALKNCSISGLVGFNFRLEWDTSKLTPAHRTTGALLTGTNANNAVTTTLPVYDADEGTGIFTWLGRSYSYANGTYMAAMIMDPEQEEATRIPGWEFSGTDVNLYSMRFQVQETGDTGLAISPAVAGDFACEIQLGSDDMADVTNDTDDIILGSTGPDYEIVDEGLEASAISVAFGTSVEEINFPKYVVTYDGGDLTADLTYDFECLTYDGNVPGSYTFTASGAPLSSTVEYFEDYIPAVAPVVTVTVRDKTFLNAFSVETASGVFTAGGFSLAPNAAFEIVDVDFSGTVDEIGWRIYPLTATPASDYSDVTWTATGTVPVAAAELYSYLQVFVKDTFGTVSSKTIGFFARTNALKFHQMLVNGMDILTPDIRAKVNVPVKVTVDWAGKATPNDEVKVCLDKAIYTASNDTDLKAAAPETAKFANDAKAGDSITFNAAGTYSLVAYLYETASAQRASLRKIVRVFNNWYVAKIAELNGKATLPMMLTTDNNTVAVYDKYLHYDADIAANAVYGLKFFQGVDVAEAAAAVSSLSVSDMDVTVTGAELAANRDPENSAYGLIDFDGSKIVGVDPGYRAYLALYVFSEDDCEFIGTKVFYVDSYTK